MSTGAELGQYFCANIQGGPKVSHYHYRTNNVSEAGFFTNFDDKMNTSILYFLH